MTTPKENIKEIVVSEDFDLLPIDDEQVEYKVYPIDKWEVKEKHKDTSWGREVYLVIIGEYQDDARVVKDKAIIDKTVYTGLKQGDYTLKIREKYSYNLDSRICVTNEEGYRIHPITGQIYTGLEMGLINQSHETDGEYISKEYINILENITREVVEYEENNGLKIEQLEDGTGFTSKEGGWGGIKRTKAGGYLTMVEVEVLPGIRETLMVSKDIRISI